MVAESSFDNVGEGLFELNSSAGGKGGAVLER
jgi:predicted outer membrane repeat protein